ncbi:MAG: hypothetical protein PHN94_10295 [Bacteroidales bacterium]|nr:hypothetical protein [Bacteroidales bacterium]
MDKFQNKYRIPSARAQWWNYGNAGVYFITICTQNRIHYFGEIVNVESQSIASLQPPPYKMQLSEIGKIAEREWLKTFDMRPDMNLSMGAFVVMPNHFHAIIAIGENEYNTLHQRQLRDAMHCVSTNTNNGIQTNNKFGPQSKNLASIIRGFKMGVTKNAREINADFQWQSRYHDHIIRDDYEYQRINNYIETNPENWGQDKFFKSEEL